MHQAILLLLLLIVIVTAFAASWFLCGLVRRHLMKKEILDHPNSRSLHASPIPRGGGLGIWAGFFLIATLGAVFESFVRHNPEVSLSILIRQAPLFFAMAMLIFTSWRDDRKPSSIYLRFAVQLITVAIGLFFLPSKALIFHGWISYWPDRLLTGFAWLWFINLFNFMDGIDGLAASETAHICLGLIVVFLMLPGTLPLIYLASLLGAILGFLIWNWPPARLFLGDVGSIPLGYLLGYFLLRLALAGHLDIALTLPLYYVADATITLARRMLEKKKFWQAHREHFYQKAALAAGSHVKVLYPIMIANAGLMLISLLSLTFGVKILLAGPLIVGVLLWYLTKLAKQK